MSHNTPMLHMLCGKIAAGKSTLAARLAQGDQTVLISEDTWLSGLYGDQMTTGADYERCATRLRGVMGPHVIALLRAGVSVVLDYPANTRDSRRWMRGLVDTAGADHCLHLLMPSDATCLERLRARNATGAHPFVVTEAQFHRFARFFEPPSPEEGLVIRTVDAQP